MIHLRVAVNVVPCLQLIVPCPYNLLVGGYYCRWGGCGDVGVLDRFMIFIVLEMCTCEEQERVGLSRINDRKLLMTIFSGWR
jgi:hypothetical protein